MTTTDPDATNRRQITTGSAALLAEAMANTETVSTPAAIDRLGADDVVFVDVRDRPELERDGTIPGAVHASRGMLEFLVDPASPFHDPALAASGELLCYCSIGGRSALAAARLQEMGVGAVAHLEGGFAAWTEADGPVAAVDG